MEFRHLSIQKKLIVIMTLVSSITILLGSAGFLISDFILERQELEESIRVHARIIATNSQAAMVFHDHEAARTIIGSLDVVASIQNVVLLDKQGKVFASYKRLLQEQPMNLARYWADLPDGLQGDALILKEPVILDGEKIGLLVIHATLTEFYQESLRAIVLILLVLTLSLPIAFVLSYRFRKIISLPIEILRRAAIEIGMARFDTHIDIDARDEIGDLAEAFRRMAGDLARQRADLEQANQAKSDFLANMSHEIRTPMNALIGLTDLALQNETSLRTRDYLNKIATSSRSLLRIINDILDFSKIEAGRLELEQHPFMLREVMDHLLNLFSAEARGKKIELIMVMAEACRVQLIGDALRLEQVLMNLLSNALKFTEQGEVEVRVTSRQEEGDRVVMLFSVRDTGIGMTTEQMASLFVPFVQGDSSTTRKYGGTGLGLSICQRLVALMGGRLWVDSVVGQGSLFSFTVTFQTQAQSQQEQDMIPPPELVGLKALVVVAHPVLRLTLLDIFRLFGFAATGAASGEEGLMAVQQALTQGAPFLLILADWRLPDGEAVDLLQQMTALYPAGQTPKRVLLTAHHGEDEILSLANRIGVEACLAKPIHCSLLFDTVMSVFGQKVAKAYRTPHDGLNADEIQQVTAYIGGARVLLVEDNTINQQVAREILESVGLEVVVAQHGREAVDRVLAAAFDGVLMDVQMPIMDGYDATRAIRQHERLQHLPIIAMTAHAMVGDREKSLAAGMNDHVVKPISRKELFSALMKWIKPRNNVIFLPKKTIPATLDTEGDDLPVSLPGIDLESALDRINHNRSLFAALLREFYQDYGQGADKLDLNNWQEAGRWVHSLKGMAGNLSAHELFHAAFELDQAIQNRQWHRGTSLLPPFKQALHQVVTGIGQWLCGLSEAQNQSQQVGEEIILDRQAIAAVIDELEGLLPQQNIKSLKVFATLKNLLADEPSVQEPLNRMDERIGRYDFANAAKLLPEITAILDKSLTRE